MSTGRRVAIVDTNILSFELKGAPLAFTYARLLADYELQICFITAAELHYGAEKQRWSQRRRMELEIMLHKHPVAPYRDGMAALYAQICAGRERAGRPMEPADAWIATTAMYHDLPLATHDADFQGTPGLRLITADQFERRRYSSLGLGARPARPLDVNCSCGL